MILAEGAFLGLPEWAFQGLPDWARAQVEWEIRAIGGGRLTLAQAVILARFATDSRMNKVWEVLLARRSNGEFVYQARPVNMPIKWPEDVPAEMIEPMLHVTPKDIQAAAIAQVIPLTFRVVVHPKYFAVQKSKDVEKVRRELNSGARALSKRATESVNADVLLQEAASMRKEAARLPTGTEHPFIIRRSRGDSTVKGVQIKIAQLLNKLFGISPGRTAATLAAVALGVDHLSERPARSASPRFLVR
jgi:hypothetical protein